MITETKKIERKNNNNIVAADADAAIWYLSIASTTFIDHLLIVVPPTFENALKAYISPW